MLDTPKDIELVHEGIVIARPRFGISLFMQLPLTKFSDELIDAFSRYRQIVGDENLRFYSTSTMNRHRKVTARSLMMLDSWFGPAAPASEDYEIEFIDAEPKNGAPRSRFVVSGREEVGGERLESASMLRYALPIEWGTERWEEAFELTRELCDLLPFRSGCSGFAFELSRYFIEDANEFAVPKSMRHPGIDIHNQTAKECNAVRFDGVRGVGWLTMLDDAFVDELGGLPEFELCSTTKVSGGVIIRAGERPAFGDVNRKDNLPAYREAFQAIEPLTRVTIEQSPWFTLRTNLGDRTEAWYKRFG